MLITHCNPANTGDELIGQGVVQLVFTKERGGDSGVVVKAAFLESEGSWVRAPLWHSSFKENVSSPLTYVFLIYTGKADIYFNLSNKMIIFLIYPIHIVKS